ncbi:30S ribosomal protein S3ae [Methanofollis formosanus]|uniref:Small ribosomal subunit protein eS1 n=1 Tax=Methanofollis formosanus TaxID=299308 RepID=A0A8G1EFP0_9EURY|nr:30S ribosomal protein S3ae [Methanofollis formosanus]QYZ78930.1 30S ribosomal protein S3ae [Methanofollis formosanus]
MAKRKQVGKRVEGWKAKSWYKVYSPEAFGKTYIGDTISADPEKVSGRVLQTTLGEITQDYGKQHIKMRFKVNNVAGDAAYTEFVGHEITRDYMRGLVKRKTSRVDSIVLATTKDGKKVRVTVTCFTINRAENSQIHAIRATTMKNLLDTAAQSTFDEFSKMVVSGDLAKETFKAIKTIFPVRRVEVIKSKVVTPVTIMA